VELRMPQVVKQNGMRSEFDEEKLRTSFTRALHKRPVPTELVDVAIDHVTQKIFALGEREIGSRQIGEMVMKELLKLDKVAYIRFASVYKSFQDVGDFSDAIDAVKNERCRQSVDGSGAASCRTRAVHDLSQSACRLCAGQREQGCRRRLARTSR
jgi:transcriptional repressor NrdR